MIAQPCSNPSAGLHSSLTPLIYLHPHTLPDLLPHAIPSHDTTPRVSVIHLPSSPSPKQQLPHPGPLSWHTRLFSDTCTHFSSSAAASLPVALSPSPLSSSRLGDLLREREHADLHSADTHSKGTHSRCTQREHGKRKRAQRKHAQQAHAQQAHAQQVHATRAWETQARQRKHAQHQHKARAGAPPRCRRR